MHREKHGQTRDIEEREESGVGPETFAAWPGDRALPVSVVVADLDAVNLSELTGSEPPVLIF